MSVLGEVGHYFLNIGKALGGQLAIDSVAFLHKFIRTDVGAIAKDCVLAAETIMGGRPSIEKRDFAVAKLKQDALVAGHDVLNWAESEAIWFVETAFQAFVQNIIEK